MFRLCGVLGLFGLIVALSGGVASGQIVTVDNTNSGFSILAGSWDSGAYGQPNGSDYVWCFTSGQNAAEPFAEVEWRPNLPTTDLYEVAVWYVPGTNRATDVTYTVHHPGGVVPVSVNQQANGETWFVLGLFSFDAGSGGFVTLDNDAGSSVVIADAIRFRPLSGATVDLTMAVSPMGTGTTSPAAGGLYTKYIGETVSISASPAAGYVFDRWQVSAGNLPNSSSSGSTTINMDQTKTLTAIFVEAISVPSFRGFWADAFNPGYKTAAQIDEMVALAVAGNYNAILPEVLAYHDNVGNGHGAYWNSNIIPKATDVTPGLDPLAYLVQQAHANGIEVHCWLVSFRVCTSWPPSGNAIMTAHPEWLMVPSGDMGGGPATVDGKYTLDPGSPDAQAYLVSVVRELTSNYDIDGIHWDYVRYTTTDAGYPADTAYDNSSLARFQRITSRSDTPSTGDGQWNDFRRRTITEFVRRAMTEVATADSPRQPLRHSGALITWGNAPTNFSSCSAYRIFQNWRHWLEMGYLDAGIPMNYYNDGTHYTWYRNWVDASIAWSYDRHLYTGPGIYLNSAAGSVDQMQYALDAGADGLCTYSYRGTSSGGLAWNAWYPYAAANIFTGPVPTPEMPWRAPVTTAESNIYGRVTDGLTGDPIDDAAILLDGADSGIRTDGNGYYLITHEPAAATGSIVSVGARYAGYADTVRSAVLVEPAGYTEANLGLGAWLPGDYDADGDVDAADYTHFANCLAGPEAVALSAGCDVFDFDADGDVDLEDYQSFAISFTG